MHRPEPIAFFLVIYQYLNARWLADNAAKNGGKRHIGRISAGGKAHHAHGNGRAGWVKQVPAVPQIHLGIGMKVWRAQRRVCAVIGSSHKTRGQIAGAAQRNHQVRKVTAYAHALHQGVYGRGGAV